MMIGAVKFVLGTVLGAAGLTMNGASWYKKTKQAAIYEQKEKNRFTPEEKAAMRAAKMEYEANRYQKNAIGKDVTDYYEIGCTNYFVCESYWLYDHLKTKGIYCTLNMTDYIVGLTRIRENRQRFADWADSL